MAHEWFWEFVGRLDPCFEKRRLNSYANSVADEAQSRLVGRWNPVLDTKCLGIVHVQMVAFLPSSPMCGVNPKDAFASHAFPRFVVQWRNP